MVAEGLWLRRFVGQVIDVFAALEVLLLVEAFQLLGRKVLVHRHQTAAATDHESFPAREPFRMIATRAGRQDRIRLHGLHLATTTRAFHSLPVRNEWERGNRG